MEEVRKKLLEGMNEQMTEGQWPGLGKFCLRVFVETQSENLL